MIGVARAKYNVDEGYFDTIDTEEKAYWIGFIWCDGTVSRRERSERNIEYNFIMGLQRRDLNHLEKLNESLGSSYSIKKVQYGRQAKSKDEFYYMLTIYNKKFSKMLYQDYGLHPRRKEISSLIDRVPATLYRHFIRGVLDADGSFGLYKINRASRPNEEYKLESAIKISTHYEIAKFINDYLRDVELTKTNFKIKADNRVNEDADCFKLNISGNQQVKRILEHLYLNADTYLDRKHERAIHIIEEINSRIDLRFVRRGAVADKMAE